MIRVLVVDDHEAIRFGLSQVLEAVGDMELVGLAEDGETGIDLALRTLPDVVLMDLFMPGVDGFDATQAILSSLVGPRVVVLTSSRGEALVARALAVGAWGYMVKSAPVADLLEGIRRAYRGEQTFVPASVARRAPRAGDPS